MMEQDLSKLLLNDKHLLSWHISCIRNFTFVGNMIRIKFRTACTDYLCEHNNLYKPIGFYGV